MRARAEHEVRSGGDDCVREPDRVAAPLTEVHLHPGAHVLVLGAFGTRVDEDDDEVCLRRRCAHARDRALDVEQVVVVVVGREAEERELDAVRLDVPRQTGTACVRQVGRAECGAGLRLPFAAVVVGVVVGEVDGVEAGALERERRRGRRLEGKAVRRSRSALGRAATAEGRLEVADGEVAAK